MRVKKSPFNRRCGGVVVAAANLRAKPGFRDARDDWLVVLKSTTYVIFVFSPNLA